VRASAALAPALRDAARVVARVAAGRSLAHELEIAGEDSAGARSALIDIANGTLRRYGRVQALVRELSSRGRPEGLVEALLWCSLYALESGRYAEYTVVDQSVRACGMLERWSAKGYVNALLRAFLRQRSSLEGRMQRDPEARYQHPRWWIDMVRESHAGPWESILAAGNAHPPMCLRVNRRRVAVSEYQAKLASAGIAARHLGREALLLERPLPVDRIPGFNAGEVSVQDAGAQRAAHCLDLADGQRVLDACAAPGGKAAHMLELADVRLTALDEDAGRCARITATLERLSLRAQVRPADCTRLAEWWDGVAYERILADVPCSASGVARRHPDLKWLRRPSDIDAFAVRQLDIVSSLWRVLGPGGKLLYVTCSVFAKENDAVIDAFVSRAKGATRIALPDGGDAEMLPDGQHDGFYFALLQKQA
jgi:16S rRNA (cytosine967-C5)-methyltransferase